MHGSSKSARIALNLNFVEFFFIFFSQNGAKNLDKVCKPEEKELFVIDKAGTQTIHKRDDNAKCTIVK